MLLGRPSASSWQARTRSAPRQVCRRGRRTDRFTARPTGPGPPLRAVRDPAAFLMDRSEPEITQRAVSDPLSLLSFSVDLKLCSLVLHKIVF